MGLTRRKCLNRVKRVIADHKGFAWQDIRAHYQLGGRWASRPRGLGYTADGKAKLCAELKGEFSSESIRLDCAKFNAAKIVGDVRDVVWSAIPDSEKEVSQ